MNKINFNNLLLNHIPVKGYGYSPIHNLTNNSLATTIQKQLEFNLEHLSDKDDCSHSMLNIQLLDKSRLVFYNTVFSLAHSDESSREGIFFGIYLILDIEEFDISFLSEISSIAESYLEKIMDSHTELKRNAKGSFNKKGLIDEFTEISLNFLNSLSDLFQFNLKNVDNATSNLNVFKSLFDNQDFTNLLQEKIIEIINEKSYLKKRRFNLRKNKN